MFHYREFKNAKADHAMHMDVAMDIAKILFEKDMDSQSNLSSL